MDNDRPFKKKTSRVPLKDYKRPEARLAVLKHHGHDVDLPGIRAAEDASVTLIENAIGSFPVPVGIATNFVINGEERLVTMATEEKSVVAGASFAAKLCRESGGFKVEVGPNVMRGQILFVAPRLSADGAIGRDDALSLQCQAIAESLDRTERTLRKHGGGLVTEGFGNNVAFRRLDGGIGRRGMLVIDFQMKVGDAMGANAVTRFGEKLAAHLEPVLGTKNAIVICSNDTTHLSGPTARASAAWPVALIGEEVAERIVTLQRWAAADSFRAVTHNKGIMNGVSAVALATGQDVRAVEASFHAAVAAEAMPYGHSMPATQYKLDGKMLSGKIALRIPLGTVGGATGHPTAVACRKLMGVGNVADLAAVIGAVGLAQNFAALRSLATEGVSEAHRRLDET